MPCLAGCSPSLEAAARWQVAGVGSLQVGLGRKAGACHHMVNSQGGDARIARGLCPTKNSQGRDPSTRRGLGPPAAPFYLASRAIFPVFRCAMAWVAHTCATLQVSTLVVERMGGLSRWRVSSVLLDVRCSFAEVKHYQSRWATSFWC